MLGDVDIGGAHASNFCQEAFHYIQKMCQITKGITFDIYWNLQYEPMIGVIEMFVVKKDGVALRNILEMYENSSTLSTKCFLVYRACMEGPGTIRLII